jgi:DNA-binding NtrC family response regulator
MNPKRILIIEDDESLRELLCELLEMEGHTVSCLSSSMDLEATVVALRPDLAVVDLMMPSGSGLEALSILGTYNPTIPSIIVSGYMTEEEAEPFMETARRMGAVSYLAKPVDIYDLLNLVQNA